MKFTTLSIARKLKFYQLIVYAQVLESGSILRAAQALNLTQPSVTKVIHELESYFGAPLLVQGGNQCGGQNDKRSTGNRQGQIGLI